MFYDVRTQKGLDVFEANLFNVLTLANMALGETFEELLNRLKAEQPGLTHLGVLGDALTMSDKVTVNKSVLVIAVSLKERDAGVATFIKRLHGQSFGFDDPVFKQTSIHQQAVNMRGVTPGTTDEQILPLFVKLCDEILHYANRPDITNT